MSGGSTTEDERRLSLPVAFRALAHRNFQLFFAGQLVSLVGTWMQSAAQQWLVYRLTHSGALLGWIGFANQIPILLIGPISGTIVEMSNRRRVVIATQAASMALALSLAALTLTGDVRIRHVFVLATLLGVVNAFDVPARQSFLVELVGKSDLMNAIALNSSMFHAARMVGPAVSGLLIAYVSEGWCFLGNGLSYIAVIAGLMAMTGTAGAVREKRKESVSQTLLEGFRYVGETTPIRVILVHIGVTSLIGVPYIVLMPIFADRILHGGPGGYGVLMAASGLGSLAAALTLASRTKVQGLGKWITISTATFGIGLVAFSHSTRFWLSAGLLVVIGFSLMLQMGAANTLVQSMVPDRLRGRVMSVYSMMLMGMAPLGALVAGQLEKRLGAPLTVLSGGVLCLASAAIFQLRRKAVRPWAIELIRAQFADVETPDAVSANG